MKPRVISKESKSMVYHRSQCRYVQRIHTNNTLKLKWEDAEWKGYRPCKCCNSAAFIYEVEWGNTKRFSKEHNLDVDLVGDKIYVRTDVGCWKIIYRKAEQKFILFHRNYVNGRIALCDADKAPYHRQKDVSYSVNIGSYLLYIQKHDDFKKNMPADIRQMPQDTRLQKKYYQVAKRREEKRSARRLDRLFLLIERKEGIKQLSFC